MKIRSGFISNSSSSSFIVPVMNNIENFNYQSLKSYFTVEDQYYYDSSKFKSFSILLPISSGNKNFGWEIDTYSDFEDKLNYLFLQIEGLDDSLRIKYALKSKLEESLQSICKKAYDLSKTDRYTFNIKIDYNFIKYDSIYDWNDLFMIDHQSTWCENIGSITDYFNKNKPNAELIEKYLIGNSYIQGGNDNDDMPIEFHESLNILKKYKENL